LDPSCSWTQARTCR